MADEYIRKTDALNASKITYIECLYLDDGGYLEGESDAIPVVFKRDIEAIPAADVRPAISRERMIAALDRYFEIGTMSLRDFVEGDSEKVSDLCDYLFKNLLEADGGEG